MAHHRVLATRLVKSLEPKVVPMNPTAIPKQNGHATPRDLFFDVTPERNLESLVWPAAGFEDTLLRCSTKPEVVHGNETAVQPGVQA